ncbi:MAG: cytochrome c, rane-bound [Phenylobacterium sp.]|nr:cytochrome c, rane-bound [Phenylobacterium sp.]
MSDLSFNKVAGALLATGLAIVGLRELSSGIFSDEKVQKPGYTVEVAADTAAEGAAAADVPPDWGTVLPKADVAAGQAVFAKCQSCHSLTANGTGPDLMGVVGRKPGTEAGFAYSPAMQAFGAKQPIWDYEHLYEFLKGPQAYVNGTKMTFVGLKKPEDRIDVIAYLHTQGSSLPIPPPNPAAATKAASAGTTGPTPTAALGGATAPGAAKPGQPTATGSTATPATGAGGPAGQGPGAPSQQNTTGATSSGADPHKP